MAPTTPGTASTWSRTCAPVGELVLAVLHDHAVGVLAEDACRFRSPSKPLITESTTVSAQTPMATPPMEMSVISRVAGMRAPAAAAAAPLGAPLGGVGHQRADQAGRAGRAGSR